MKSLISKNLLQKKKEEERRTKQSLDSPQTIEANKKCIVPTYIFKKSSEGNFKPDLSIYHR